MEQEADQSLTLKLAGADKLLAAVSKWISVPVPAVKASLENSVAAKKPSKDLRAEIKLLSQIKKSSELSSEEKLLFINRHLGDEFARVFRREEKRSSNIRGTVAKAIAYMPNEVEDASPDGDLIDYILGQAQEISNEKVQDVWALILAREVTTPGSFSRRTLSNLMLFDKKDVEMLRKLTELALVPTEAPNSGACFLCDRFTWGNLKYVQGFPLAYSDILNMVDAGFLLSAEPDIHLGMPESGGPLILQQIASDSLKIKLTHPEITGFVLSSVGFQLCQLIPSSINEDYLAFIVRQFNATVDRSC